MTLYNLRVGNRTQYTTYILTIATGTILTTQGYFYSDTDNSSIIYLGGGEIAVQGNIETGAFPSYATGTASIVLDGTGAQLVGDDTLAGSGYQSDAVALPNLTIQKTSGGVTLAGQIQLGGNFTNTNTTAISPGTSTMIIGPAIYQGGVGQTFGSAGVTATLTGSSTFNNLVFGDNTDGIGDTSSIFTIATGTTLTAQGYFDSNTNAVPIFYLGGGMVTVQGNIETGYDPYYATGTVGIVLDGTGTQIVGDDTVAGGGYTNDAVILPDLTIQKTSGGVTLAGQIQLGGNFTNTNTTAISPGTSTMIIGPAERINHVGTISAYSGVLPQPSPARPPSTTSSSALILMEAGNGNSIFTIATGTTLTAQGYFYPDTDESSVTYLGGGTINVQGNIEAGYQPYDATGTASIVLDGTGAQLVGDDTVAGGGSLSNSVILPNLTVLKNSGIAYAEGPSHITGSVTVAQGEFQLATSSLATTVEVDGPLTVSSGARLSDYPVASSTLSLGSSVTNNGMIFFDGSAGGCTATLPNEVIINSTTTGKQVPWYGSGQFIIRYANVEDQGGTASVSVLNGTNSGDDGANWNFMTGPRIQLIQSSTAVGGAGTAQLTLPAFGFAPRAGDLILVAVSSNNQSITAPTDNASNTYVLVASTTFDSSPSHALSLYYAKNINTTSSFAVTVNGTPRVAIFPQQRSSTPIRIRPTR